MSPRVVSLLILGAALLVAPRAFAGSEEKAERLQKAYDRLIEKTTSQEGLLTVRRSKEEPRKIYLELTPEDLETPLLLFPSIAQGIAQSWVLGGQTMGGDDWVFEFRRVDERIQVVRKNIRFRADEDSPMAHTVELSYSDSVTESLAILGRDAESKNVLVRIDPFLRGDLLSLGRDLTETFGTGMGLVGERTRISLLKVFAENIEVEVEQTFASGEWSLVDTVPDGRAVGITMHYSILALPETEDFEPRLADDRVGHFLTALKDHSSTDVEGPWVRYVNRWHLEKSDPDAERSPVVQPIVFYISRSTPYEFRPYVRDGIEVWRKAFDRIGLLEAIEVRQQSDDDDWEPGDVRYNTFTWISEARFAGKGPSRAHPLTGELLDADILYNGAVIGGMRRRYQVSAPREPEAGAQEATAPTLDQCDFQRGFTEEVELAGLHWLASQEAATPTSGTSGAVELPLEFLGAAVRKTTIHEVGHVLGLRHNFKGSAEVPMDKLHDLSYTREHGVTASIMDYPAANIAPPGKPQGEYFSSTIGPYDYWAIEYAYAPLDIEDEADDGERAEALASIAGRGTEPGLAFGSDEDRWSGGHRNVDPEAQAYDLGDDPLAYARERFTTIRGLWDHVLERVVREGEGYTRARYAVRVLLGGIRTAANVALPWVGGQFHHRDHRTEKARAPFVPVPATRQRDALTLLCDTLFKDEQYELSPELLNRLAPNHAMHWGAEGLGKRIDFPLHDYIRKVQSVALSRLLSTQLLARMTDAVRQVPADQAVFTPEELMSTLTDRVFEELEVGPKTRKWTLRDPYVSTMRRNLQRSLLIRLAALTMESSGTAPTDAALVARHTLGRLRARLAKAGVAPGLDAISRAHLQDLEARAAATLEAVRVRRGL